MAPSNVNNTPWSCIMDGNYAATRQLLHEFVQSVRPGAQLDKMRWGDLATLLWFDFASWCDAHPNRELVEEHAFVQNFAMALLWCELVAVHRWT
jgi:hypothetical protein